MLNRVWNPELEKRYQVLELLGSGAYGRVFKAKCLRTGEDVAIKEFDYGHLAREDVNAVHEEVRLISKLSNPFLVKYLDVYDNKMATVVHIVMEYCPNGDLQQLMFQARRTRAPIGEDEIWRCLAMVAHALDYMHRPFKQEFSQKIIHRDLKPANIMVASGSVYKLCDFNLCRPLATGNVATTMAFTPLYAAPELLTGKEYTEKVDLWSLGCILYEMCTFSPPYVATTIEGIRELACNSPVPEIGGNYSADLREVITSLLQKDPQCRYSAHDLLAHRRVQAVLQSLGIVFSSSIIEGTLSSTKYTDFPAPTTIQQGLQPLGSRQPVQPIILVYNAPNPICTKGEDQYTLVYEQPPPSESHASDHKSYCVIYVLWFFLGFFGGNRFYVRKWCTAFLWLFTLGLFGLGWLADSFLNIFMIREYNARVDRDRAQTSSQIHMRRVRLSGDHACSQGV
ncbi:Kinase, NEK [Giardia muris]|uniref:non-specific serine/threonine protein kinase n=1 Tax=Giardia muris TaxID=5742 RepID=A0A4Z1SPH0_GIAMU|nr:Kinase, NEK [Giardia muris]|eukprot:TNJ27540.1 Kinase, NEK [Giardia muris]